MDETTAKMASSSLAIIEKKPHSHRPAGCVGIFFQLFDWNRRFAKKKLFSKKLLPTVRAKQVSKKFARDEKMPKTKLHLIANENSGGFPNMKRNGRRNSFDLEKKSDMRAPGLVARLMGLDSMPDVHKDKPKKPSFAGSSDGRDEKFVNERSGCSGEDLKDKCCGQIESRPQKIQRTEQFERRVVTRFGAEALQIKSVLSRSRRNYHPKLHSPFKSPRVSSARNVSRTSGLIDTATKILEPGLQATNRAKSVLTYSSSTLFTTKDEDLTEARMEFMSPDLSTQSTYNVGICKSFMGKASCRNCGNMLDVVDSRPNVDEQPFVHSSSASNFVNVSSTEPGKSKPSSPVSSLGKERDVVFRQRGQPISLSALEKSDNKAQLGSVPSPDRKPSLQEGQVQWKLTSRHCKPQNEEPSSFTSLQRTQNQNQMSLCRDRMPLRAKLSNLPSRRVSSAANNVSGAKDFVALNRNLSGCTRPRVPSKVDSSSIDAERKSFSQQDGSLSHLRTPVRKRRTISFSGPIESTGFINSKLGRQKNFRGDIVTGKGKGLNSCSVDRASFKSKAACERDSAANGDKESDVISFTFNSPLRHKTGNAKDIKEKINDQNDPTSKSASFQTMVMDENVGGSSLKKQLPLTGDALGALLEEKLKELTSQEEDELITAGTPPKRSSAVILQELISALTAEQPISLDGHVSLQSKAKTKVTSVGFAHDGEHLSKTGNAKDIKEKINDQNDPMSKSASFQTMVMDENVGGSSLKKQLPLTGDALGALLEEKLKELTSQEEDELITAGTPPKRSSAVILQELISALTAEQPISLDGHVSLQSKAKTKVTSVGFAHDGEHLSPGSVLEASFSNDSCVSSSIDDSSGRRLQDSMDFSPDQLQPAAPDTDLLDSATSLSKGSAGNQMVIDIINQISRLLLCNKYVDLGLTGSKLSHAKDVILNAELLFGNTWLHKSGGMKDFLVAPFLLDELEVLASAMRPKFNCLLGFESTKEGNQLGGFLSECWIECFDAKYGRYCNSGFKAWTRLPLRMKAEMLIREVGEEVTRWTHLAGMTHDEIIECEMSHSMGKWTDFDIEGFETGAQIGLDILQILVEEIVIDIWDWECMLVSF